MKITLCGSARFEEEFIEANKELSLLGHVVYSLAVMPSTQGGKDWYNEPQKEMLDLVHLAKIDASDAVVVVGDGYIGQSTKREVAWAEMKRKIIVYSHIFDDFNELDEWLRNHWTRRLPS